MSKYKRSDVGRMCSVGTVVATQAAVLLLTGAVALGQQPRPMMRAADRMAGYDTHVQMSSTSPFKDVEWQFLGPNNVSGRVTDVAVKTPRGQHYTIYAATASGGVWKTVNDGLTWDPIFDDAASTSIGDITLAPSNQDVIYLGTGEANIFRSSMAGCGVYRSDDAGETWTHVGLEETHTIARIVVHPTNPEIAYVAATGNEWTDNPERGVYKTTDGGKSWSHVHFVSERTGAIDLVIDPSDPDTLYAATWQRIRRHWNDPRIEAGYDESGIYKTTDGGRTWTRLRDGLPAPQVTGRVGIDLCASEPNTIYALIDNYEPSRPAEPGRTDSYGRPVAATIRGATVYRSDDAGDTWRQVSQNNRQMERMNSTYGWVFGQLRVDPTDPDTIYVMGLALNQSHDSGETFRPLRGMHGDHHALWIDPNNSQFLVNGNDGGLALSYDGGVNWRRTYDTLPAVQFYNVGYDMAEPFHVYGSIQDHGSRRGVVDLSRGRDRIRSSDWENAPGGEASTHVIDPTDPDVVYSAGFYGSISRNNLASGDRASLVPTVADGEHPLRGQWLAPFIISPHNPRIIYHGMNFLYRSMDRGDGFEKISPDLTHNDVDKIGDIPYQTIFAIAESPQKFGLLYAGTDDGRVHVTRDGGDSWKDITKGLVADRWISRIVASQYDEATVYVAQNGKRNEDFAPYIWKSSDYGTSWKNIAANIPVGPINVVREDPRNANVLYAGTDVGVYVTMDGGTKWQVLGSELPSTFVHDLIIHPRDDVIVIATHGRGMWALDAKPIRVLSLFSGDGEDAK